MDPASVVLSAGLNPTKAQIYAAVQKRAKFLAPPYGIAHMAEPSIEEKVIKPSLSTCYECLITSWPRLMGSFAMGSVGLKWSGYGIVEMSPFII
jgi:hypothetical protein